MKKDTVDCEERFSEGGIHGGTRVREVGAANVHDRLAGIKHERGGIGRGLRLDEHAPTLPCAIRNQEPLYWKIEENGRRKAQTGGESKGRRGESIAAEHGGCAVAAWDRERSVVIVKVRRWSEWKTRSSCQSPNTACHRF